DFDAEGAALGPRSTGETTKSSRPIFNLIYSTNWVCTKQQEDPSLPWELQVAAKRMNDKMPLCCELTNLYFCELLAKAARAKGFRVVRWPVKGRSKWLAVGEAARSGRMKAGAAAVLMHSWGQSGYEKECVPAWDFYPVLDKVKARQMLLYPSATLDRLHSEKRYDSALMPPTQFLTLIKRPGSSTGWRVKGHGFKAVSQVATEALASLREKAIAEGLPFDNVMVKQGLSWGGEAVTRLKPSAVPDFIERKILPKIPAKARSLTILLQAKLELVSELRWMVLNGELRGRGWKTLKLARPGATCVKAGYLGEKQSQVALAKAGLAPDAESRRKLEESLRGKVEQVVAEAVADSNGEVPQWLRVDLLMDKSGRAWLGERESWGADLIENSENPMGRMSPNKTEVARAIVARAADALMP
ncbi:unnamed protein product, partial [Polarella glacialis]